jgi:hypothetical protein
MEKHLLVLKRDMIKINRKSLCIFIGFLCICGLASFYLLRKPYYKNLLEVPGFFDQNRHFIPLKISGFSWCNSPQIEITIENHVILSEIDLGWRGGIALLPATLHDLCNKTFVGRYPFSGLTGKIYESNVYELPQIHIGKMKIFSMRAKEENLEFLEDSILKKGDQDALEQHQGRIGWCVFKPFNMLLDCEHSAIIMCDSLATLKEQGFPVDSFIEAPLLLDRDSIDFKVITEAGPLRCTLDTGSTWNLLNKDLQEQNQNHRMIDLDHMNEKMPTFNLKNENLLIFNPEDRWETKTFQINGNEFGPVNFVQVKSPLGLDVILGMEFIDDHLIFIDFQNEKIYFSKLPEERSLLVRVYDFLENKIRNLQ